jgi:hypothetical protein
MAVTRHNSLFSQRTTVGHKNSQRKHSADLPASPFHVRRPYLLSYYSVMHNGRVSNSKFKASIDSECLVSVSIIAAFGCRTPNKPKTIEKEWVFARRNVYEVFNCHEGQGEELA